MHKRCRARRGQREREKARYYPWQGEDRRTRMREGERGESGFRTPRPSSGVWQKRRRFDVYENETVIVKEGLRRKRFHPPPPPSGSASGTLAVSFVTGHTVDLATVRFLLFLFIYFFSFSSLNRSTFCFQRHGYAICHSYPSIDDVREISR